jgi:hypothetical protein
MIENRDLLQMHNGYCCNAAMQKMHMSKWSKIGAFVLKSSGFEREHVWFRFCALDTWP